MNAFTAKEHFSNDIQKEGFLRLPAVLALIPVCKATWWNGCKSGRFPKPYKLGPKVTGWKVKDILQCLNDFPQSNDQG
ncbi:helix-turn-helix transcriptional regulator [Puia sp.]|uniref:helix-turn-helix transcriptional regulator n=1 Tax=Puia sp. TaxID=2045100 RepID=UPI0039C91DC4